jgi:sRNA-binding regulator protein Hfq
MLLDKAAIWTSVMKGVCSGAGSKLATSALSRYSSRLRGKRMAEEPTTREVTAGKFQAHGVQNDWLNQAKGKSVEILLDNGQTLNGRLVGHDIYCLALDEVGQEGDTLVYKQSISYVRVCQESASGSGPAR